MSPLYHLWYPGTFLRIPVPLYPMHHPPHPCLTTLTRSDRGCPAPSTDPECVHMYIHVCTPVSPSGTSVHSYEYRYPLPPCTSHLAPSSLHLRDPIVDVQHLPLTQNVCICTYMYAPLYHPLVPRYILTNTGTLYPHAPPTSPLPHYTYAIRSWMSSTFH